MNLFLRQIWALIRKNLLIICLRRPISTFIRALAIPLAIVLIVAYSKEFFASPQKWGVSSSHPIRSLKDGLAASDGRDIVGFIDNGMKGGDVASVIDSLSRTVKDAGKTPKFYNDTLALAQECINGLNGASHCYGAVVFYSSPEQGTNISEKGTWNYSIRGESSSYGGFADVTNDKNAPEIYLLPLQLAVDTEIISRSKSANVSSLPKTIKTVLYTDEDQATLDTSRTSNFLGFCIYAFGVLFTFTLVNLVYHMTSFVASERELGISALIDTMAVDPRGSNIRGRLVRQISTYISFAVIYFPSWIAIGVVISVLVFPKTSHGLPVGFTIFAGLAMTSFSLFGASFFKKSQLSGSIMVVIAIVFAILPQTLYEQTRVASGILSFIFPTAAYTYLVTGTGRFEQGNQRVALWKQAPDSEAWRIKLGILWIFLVIQIIVYPILAFFVEHLLFSTASSNRIFAAPTNPQDPTVTLSSFCKTYKPGILARIFKRRKPVRAVVNMDLNAHPGQILCLLGPNGSGKSTTMNCIAGQHKVTSGCIAIDPSGGLGYAPQNNVIWPEITVEEHIRIFSNLKCLAAVNEEIVTELVQACDLQKKLPCQAKTLSGGQKRKLQLAMMFAGGSAVCCVDEVSTGLDPISRRRIWEILLAERHRRTIIMTTHFLDEADYLADNVAIMYEGSLRAVGTSTTLKNKYGNGYTVKLPENKDIEITISSSVHKEISRHQVVYRIETAALAAELVEYLESKGISEYQVAGPTMEELFLKATGKDFASEESSSSSKNEESGPNQSEVVVDFSQDYQLAAGKPISVYKQWYTLFCKRVRILRRRWVPYFVAVAFAIVGAGVAPLLIKSFKKPMQCPQPSQLIFDYTYRSDFGSSSSYAKYLIGPSDKVNQLRLDQMAGVYSSNHTPYPKYDGYSNGTQLRDQLIIVNSFDEISEGVKKVQDGYSSFNSYSEVEGGIWLADDSPTVIVPIQKAQYASSMMNFLSNMLSGVPISSAYSEFGFQQMPEDLFHGGALIFMVYYGLIMAVYPAFFTLYPTNERISNVRSMQYSNGIRPIPLWLSHLAFDGVFIIVVTSVATGLLSASTPVWFGMGYIFIILLLYGITMALLSYVISMFAKSAVTSWFLIALGQVIFYFAYFGGMIGVQSTTTYNHLEGQLNSLFFGMGVVSPVVCLQRAFTIGLGQFAALCNGHSAGSVYLFGGPILYLALQLLVLFVLLLWWDSSFKLLSFRSRNPVTDAEATDMYSSDLMSELKRLNSSNTDLRIESVSKSFGKNLAVDNVTFGVQSSEIFALLGPNGAGKSTIISMIRGDIKPSTSNSAIDIAGHSILTAPVNARSNLGVCPQFDSADVLTVSETLRFFAKTRGVTDIEHNVSTVISACGLAPWADQLAQKLSGGTKRKLSLAVALVGNPRVLVLDEPSSALDANAKRTMWKCLQSIGKGRAVVLTTHSMEEADALADRIGIMSSRMLALGEREAIKKRAGDAFHIHLVSCTAPRTTQAELQGIKYWIEQTFPSAQISRETQGGQIRFELPAEGHSLVKLIRILENVKGDLGVEFYSIGKATLDEVFEKIVKRYGDYTEK